MRPQLLLGLALAACGGVAGGAAAGPRVTASVSDVKRHDLSSLLYSIFFETEINYGSEGGLYAELLPNRDFERLGRGSGPAGADGSGSSSSNSAAAASQNASSPAPGAGAGAGAGPARAAAAPGGLLALDGAAWHNGRHR